MKKMTDTANDSDMTSGVIWKQMLRFFFPVAAGSLFQMLYNAADALIVGKFVGTEALASVGGSSSAITGLMVSIFVSLACGSSVVVSQYYGARNEHAMTRATGTAIMFCLILGIGLTAVCEGLRDFLLRLLNTPEEIMQGSSEYMGIYFLSIVFMLLTNVESGILRAVGDSRNPFIYMLVSCLTNIVLDLLLVAVIPLGIAGAAWATVAAQVLNAVLAGLKLIRTKEAYRIDRKYLKLDRQILGDMMRLGIPAALQTGMYAVSNMIVQTSINAFGTVVVASWSLVGKLHGVYDAVEIGMDAAVTTFGGQNFGAKKYGRIREGYRTALRMFFPAILLAVALVLGTAPFVIRFFTVDPAVEETTYLLLWYIVPFFPAGALITLNCGILRGCGEVRKPTLISALCICVFRIIWINTVCRIRSGSLPLVIFVYGISYILAGTVLTVYYVRWIRRTLAVDPQEEP